ncbi:MAG TPA: hypothetical protein VF710_20805 [Longimicrobium sp.]
MPYVVRKGVPEILELWKRLLKEHKQGVIGADDRELFKKWSKATVLLRDNPKHPGLNSHEIDALTQRYGRKVFQSYLENNTPGAGRLFWVYGPEEGQITVIGLEPHPEDRKSQGYARVRLSKLPAPDPPAGKGASRQMR